MSRAKQQYVLSPNCEVIAIKHSRAQIQALYDGPLGWLRDILEPVDLPDARFAAVEAIIRQGYDNGCSDENITTAILSRLDEMEQA